MRIQTVNNAGGGPGGNAFIAKFGATAGVTFLPTTTTLSSTTAGANITFTAVVKPVTGTGVPTGTVNFYVNSVKATTVTLDPTGTATYTTNQLTDTLSNVIAAYSGDATYGASGSSLGQTPGATATQLVFTSPPAAAIGLGGNGGTAVVTVEDALGNIVTTPSVTVTVTITGPAGYTPQTLPVATAGGIATFNFANTPLTIPGIYSYIATSSGLISTGAFETVSPVITSISPGDVTVGSPAVTLNLIGNFIGFQDSDDVVCFSGPSGVYPSSFGSTNTTANTTIPAAAMTLAGAVQVFIGNSDCTTPVSNNAVLQVANVLPATTATLAITPSPVAYGKPVTLTATVTIVTGAPVTPGQVVFCNFAAATCNGQFNLGSAQLNASGVASLPLSPGAVGVHSYQALFLGTTAAASVTSAPASVTVTGTYPTTTTLAATGNPGSYTLTGTVVGLGVSVPTPTGSVSIIDQTNSNAVLGTAPLGTVAPAQTLVAASGSPLTTGTAPYAVATGDFNGDGFTDLAVENYTSDTVSVFLGNGDGTFKPQVTYAVGIEPEGIAAADVNGDGKLDLVVTNTGSGSVGVLLGNGDGTFQTQVTYPTDDGPAGIVVADFNNDGKLDIATSNYYAADVSILLGNGDGTFQAEVTYAAGNEPRTLTSGDFNGDGNIDLAVANQEDNTVSILFGKGDGTFQAQVLYPTGVSPQGLAVADFNGDGIPDLAIANSGNGVSGNVEIMLGSASGVFGNMTVYAAGNGALGPVVADFNGDGIADIAVENFTDSTESLLLGNGDGTFQAQTVFPTGTNPYGAAVGNFNGGGNPDLAISNFGSSNETILLDQVTSTATAVLSPVAVPGAPGNHNVVATYPGDTNFTASTSAPVVLVAQPAVSTPTITSLSPNTAVAGSANLVVTITGTQFLTGAAVTVNGTSQAATFVSATQLTTTLTAAQLSAPATLSLVVVNPDGGTSNAAIFTVTTQLPQVTPTTIDFGNQTVEVASTPQVVTLSNTTGGDLSVLFIGISNGINISDFAETNNCPAILAAAASCQISVTFTPGAVGARLAYLSVATSAASQAVVLTGTGTGGILQVNPGNLKTIAGNGTAGYTGDGGPGPAAELHAPEGIAFDAQGNLYIADSGNNVVRKVDTAGNITTVAGTGAAGFSGDGGPATSAQISAPWGVVVDAKTGNLYIGDSGNHRIRKVDPSGTISTYAGNGQIGNSGDGGPAIDAEFNIVLTTRTDAAGNLYIGDCYNSNVRKIDTGGVITTIAGTGVFGYSGDGGPATGAQVGCPLGVFADAAGDIFIADFGNANIRMVNPSGIISTVAGNSTRGFSGDGGPALSAQLNTPADVVLDATGNLYIADDGNSRIRKVDTTGTITTVAGGLNDAGSAVLDSPLGLALDAASNLYLSDFGNNAVRQFFPAGAVAFPATDIGTAATPLTVTLSNIGNLPVTIASEASFALSGNAADFSLTGGSCLSGATLAANGGSCTLQIGFTPTATGTRTLIVSITDDAIASPQSFQITGTGIQPAVSAPTITSLSPNTAVAGSANLAVTINGTQFLTGAAVTVNGTSQTATFVSVTQLTTTLTAAQLSTAGTLTLAVVNPDGGTSNTAAFTVTQPAVSAPTIASLSPNSAYVDSGNTTVTITGTQFLTGAAVTVNGTSQTATFVSATQLTTTLTAAQLSTVGTLTLAVVNPDGGTSNTAAFTVVQLPLQLAPASLAFGNQTVGTPSAPQVVTVTNTTATAITITSIILDLGLNPGDFAQTNNCPATLAAGANCAITIIFTPSGVGAKSAGLLVTDNSPVPAESVNMTGTGTGGILQVNPGNLKTIAGNGTAGYSGDGGPATAAELNDPDGVNFDAQGNLYIADVVNNVIRKVDTAGNITTVAGNGTAGFSGDGGLATAAELNGPFDVTPDSAGNLYIQDTFNARIRKVDATTGIITTIAGNGTFGYSGDGGPATAAELNENQGARFDAAGNLYVPDCGNGALRKIDTAGIITTVAGTGTDGFSGDGGPATSAQLNCPSGVAIDTAGDLFIADYLNNRIRKVDAATGIITTIAGSGTPGFTGDGGPALSAEINLPNDVDLDTAGDVYIADSGNNRIREIDTTGVITTVVGGLNNAGSAGINAPSALAMDKNDNLYFSDAGNNAVREVFPAGALAFPATPIGTAATALTVTLANIGNLPVTIASQESFGLSGNTADFSLVGGTCLAGATLAANGGSCTLQIGFTPTALGTRTLTVSITDDAVYSPQSFQISGTGVTPTPVVLNTISPTGVLAGAGDTTITATGANFTPTSVVNFNTTPLVTTFVSATQLTAVVPAALLTTAGTANVTVSDAASGSTSPAIVFTILPGTPAVVTFTAPPTNPGEQPTLNFSLTQGYPVAITGTMTLTFAPDTGNPDNPQIQLASTTTGVTVAQGGRSLTFPLAANSTATPVVMVQVGNVSGTITITLQLTAAGVNVTPANVVPITIVVQRVAPTITALSFTTAGNILTVQVTGFSTTREIQSATFNFTPASGASLNQKTLTVPATTLFQTWYTTTGSALYGSAFTYTQLFTLSGPATAVGGVGVTLTNSIGTSTEATSP